MNFTDERLDSYVDQFFAEIDEQAADNGEAPNQAFLPYVLEKLQFAGELDDPQICFVDTKGYRGKRLKIDGYGYDYADASLYLFVSDFSPKESLEPLTQTEIQTHISRMENFVEAAYDGTFKDYVDEFEESVKVSNEIRSRLHAQYTDTDIQRIKFYILTDRPFSTRVHSIKTNPICGKETSVNFWGLERFYELDKSGEEREPITVSFEKYGLKTGLQCIEANIGNNDEYQCFLCIIPALVLAKVYDEYGSTLLEQNVRAFLGEKSKYNKGIIKTIKTEPDRFFIYNNGIAVTGKKLDFHNINGIPFISEIEDMQIINGGQTTASLYSQYRVNPDSLNNIYVSMKLTILKNDDKYDEVVSNISRYSNSQTKVSDADFFSSHPFHVLFEQLSKKIPAPAKEGESRNTYWFYERARGKYNQAIIKKDSPEAKEFVKKFPKSQKIQKEDLAKYYMTAKCRPYDVAKGRAKNLGIFAPLIDDLYKADTDHTKINKQFFQDCISYAIIFQETDKLVSKQPWYKVGGFKNIIVPYAIAKVFHDWSGDKSLDLSLIWKRQTMFSALKESLEGITKLANDFFSNSPNNMLPTEYAKKKESWDKFSELPFEYPSDFSKYLVSKEEVEEQESSERKQAKEDATMNHLIEIYKLGPDYWYRLMKEGYDHRLLTSKESSLLKLAAECTTKGRYISNSQANAIWKIRAKLGQGGIIIESDN